MSEGIAQVRLDDGTVIYARISEARQPATSGGYRDSGLGDRVTELASGLADTVRGVAQSVRLGLAAAAPDGVRVEFGLELAVQEGRLVSLLANAQGTASVNVTLTWTGGQESSDGSPDESSSSAL